MSDVRSIHQDQAEVLELEMMSAAASSAERWLV